MRFLSRTPVRSFVVYPVVSLLWELAVNGNQFQPNLWFTPLMIWAICNIGCAVAIEFALAVADRGWKHHPSVWYRPVPMP